MQSNALCEICGIEWANFTCLSCNIVLCAQHLGKHIENNPLASHNPVPGAFNKNAHFEVYQEYKRTEMRANQFLEQLNLEIERAQAEKQMVFEEFDRFQQDILGAVDRTLGDIRKDIETQFRRLETQLKNSKNRIEDDVRSGDINENTPYYQRLARMRTNDIQNAFPYVKLFRLLKNVDITKVTQGLQESIKVQIQEASDNLIEEYYSQNQNQMTERVRRIFQHVLGEQYDEKITGKLKIQADFTHFTFLLTHLDQMKSLYLKYQKMTENEAQTFHNSIKHIKQLESLSIQRTFGFARQCGLLAPLVNTGRIQEICMKNCRISSQFLEDFSQYTPQLSNLRKLDLSFNQLKDECVPCLNRMFEHLDLHDINLQSNDITQICPHFALMTNLQSLNIGENALDVYAQELLSGNLERLKLLKRLVLSNMKISDLVYKALCHLNQLEELVLFNTRPDRKDCEFLGHQLAFLKNLRILDISQNQMDQNKFMPIISQIQQLTNLRVLNLYENKLDEACFNTLALKFPQICKLECLYIGKNQITFTNDENFADNIIHLENLVELQLIRTRFNSAIASSLFSRIRNLVRLSVLDIRECNLMQYQQEELCRSLTFFNSLVKLKCWGCQFSFPGILSLSEALVNHKNLQELDIGQTNVGEQGSARLCGALSELHELQTLNLWGCKLGIRGMRELVSVFPNTQKLKSLFLSENLLKSEGTIILSQGLQNLKNLKNLYLTSNEIEDICMVELSHNLPSSLRHLAMFSNKITTDGAFVFLQELDSNVCLKFIELHDNDIEDSPTLRSLTKAELIIQIKKAYLN